MLHFHDIFFQLNRIFQKHLAISCKKIKSSESVNKQPTQLMVELNSPLACSRLCTLEISTVQRLEILP